MTNEGREDGGRGEIFFLPPSPPTAQNAPAQKREQGGREAKLQEEIKSKQEEQKKITENISYRCWYNLGKGFVIKKKQEYCMSPHCTKEEASLLPARAA